MKILFQGDSITDAGRDRTDCHDMGLGYPKYASGMIEDSFPDCEFEFINLGISGNRTENLLERLESDVININPDILSVLLGINDVWHRYSPQKVNTSDEQFEHNYNSVLSGIREKTNSKIIILSPFLLDAPEVQNMRGEVDRVINIVKKLADRYADVYVPLDDIFREAVLTQPKPRFYSDDGVHPNAEGACLIGEKYLEAISPVINECLKTGKASKQSVNINKRSI